MTVNYREEVFRKRFDEAAKCFSVKPDQVVSMKIRESVNSYDDYRTLIHSLEVETGLRVERLGADFQGHGYLIGDNKTKVIVVEHETGLEILYIVGSVASLISLVPIVLQGWRAIRGKFSGRHGMPDHGYEIRRMDAMGRLHEEHKHSAGAFMSTHMLVPALVTAAGLIEEEMKILNQQMQSMTDRLGAIEKSLPASKSKGQVNKKTKTSRK